MGNAACRISSCRPGGQQKAVVATTKPRRPNHRNSSLTCTCGRPLPVIDARKRHESRWPAWNCEETATLARFVSPLAPNVEEVLDALRTSFGEGVGTMPVNRLAALVYRHLAESAIIFDHEPYSPGFAQRVRSPSAILRKARPRVATCLDCSLMFAAIIEAAGGEPVLFQFLGPQQAHAIVGAWLRPPINRQVVYMDRTPFNLSRPKNVAVLESTGVTINQPRSFREARTTAKALFRDPSWSFRFALDVVEARRRGIMPWGYAE